MDWKRILLIFGFLLLVGVIGFLLYLFFFAPPAPVEEPAAPPDIITGLPEGGPAAPPRFQPGVPTTPTDVARPLGEEVAALPALPTSASEAFGGAVQITELESDRSLAPTLAGDGKNVISFDIYDGTFYRFTPDGQAEKLTDQTFVGAEEVQWSSDASKAVIGFIDESNIIYDFETKKQVTIPKHWENFDFSPGGDEIVFKSLADDVENRFLVIANDDGSGARAVEPLGERAGLFEVTWSPSDQIVAIVREGIDGSRQRLYFVGKNSENFKSAVVEGRGIETKWSPQGDRLLYSGYSAQSGFKPEMWIMNALGESIGKGRQPPKVECIKLILPQGQK
ncbi:hypothetical protein HYV71_01655 [Candidatus Uhrbacteria bacterium]|nr:hypothetical protein [Candidatus Uhrbacteria bacterium]